MACEIVFKIRRVSLSNQMFARLIDFAIEVGEKTATESEKSYVRHMKDFHEDCWLGRGIEIEVDFPDPLERKFWCRVFFDTSRAIFDRSIGIHDYCFWQAATIYQAFSTANLFEFAVCDSEPGWSADTVDRREFDKVVNRIE